MSPILGVGPISGFLHVLMLTSPFSCGGCFGTDSQGDAFFRDRDADGAKVVYLATQNNVVEEGSSQEYGG